MLVFNKFSTAFYQIVYLPYNSRSFLVNTSTEISTSVSSLWHAKFVESFKLISESPYETLKLDLKLLESIKYKTLPHLALQVDNKFTNFTSNTDIFMHKHWPNFPSYNYNKVTFSCEFIQQSKVNNILREKICSTTPFIGTNEISPYSISNSLDFVELTPNLENLFIDVNGSPHFWYTTLVYIPFAIETVNHLIIHGIGIADVTDKIDPLLENKHLSNNNLVEVLRDIIILLYEDLHSQNLKSQNDKLLYIERMINGIKINTNLKIYPTDNNGEFCRQYKLNKIKLYKGQTRLT